VEQQGYQQHADARGEQEQRHHRQQRPGFHRWRRLEREQHRQHRWEQGQLELQREADGGGECRHQGEAEYAAGLQFHAGQ